MRKKRLAPTVFAWLAAGLMALIVSVAETGPGLPIFATLGLVHSVAGFVRLGDSRITAGGVFLLSTGLFVYFPALYIAAYGPSFPMEAATGAVAISYFVQVFAGAFWWGNYPPDPDHLEDRRPTSQFAFFMGLFLTAAGIYLDVGFGLGSTTLGGAATFVGVTMLAVAALSGPRLTAGRLFLTLTAVGVYVYTMFDGGGRLVLGSLALAVMLALNMARPRMWHKVSTLVALPIGLLALASNRAEAVMNSRGGAETGLESVIWPFERFAQLLHMSANGTLPWAWGETLVAPVVFLVPRAIWPDKPIGFGAELAAMFRPELVGVGHSEAALIHGEATYNFGILGLAALVPLLGYGIRFIDGLLVKSRAMPLDNRRSVLFRTTMILITAGLFDLVWVGTFGVAARTGQRLVILFIVFFVCVVMFKGRQGKRLSRREQQAKGR